MDWFELTRDMRGAIWVVVLFATSGAVFRRERRLEDPLWAVLFFTAIAILGYNVRWLMGIPSPPSGDMDILSRAGLNVLLSMIGARVLQLRWQRAGWRW